MAAVAFDSVSKRFGDVVAVDDLDLHVEDHELLVLLGPSGCGKSTALRLVAGLDEPTEGVIRIGEDVANGVDPKDRDVAMVFQSYALYPHLSVRRNIEFPLRSRHVAAPAREAAVVEAARILGLEELLDRRPAQLSGGQRQRVALARALVRRPRVFLMDEPLSNLDAKLRVQARAEVVDIQHRLMTTTIYVTHDQVEAMTMADRVAVMDQGRLLQLGPPMEVYASPADVFVARFLGSPPMSTVAGTVEPGSPPRLVVSGGSVPLGGPQADLAAATPGRQLLAGIRPEEVALSSDGSLSARVVLVEPLGSLVQVVCQTPDGSEVVVQQRADVSRPAAGEAVRLAVQPGKVHLFDAASGGRL